MPLSWVPSAPHDPPRLAILPLRIEEFPFPAPTLGFDMVWNPRLQDDRCMGWLRGILRDVTGEL